MIFEIPAVRFQGRFSSLKMSSHHFTYASYLEDLLTCDSVRVAIFLKQYRYTRLYKQIVQAVHGGGPFPVVSRLITPLIGLCNTSYQYIRPFIRVYNPSYNW